MRAQCPACEHEPTSVTPDEATVLAESEDWVVVTEITCPECGAAITIHALSNQYAVLDLNDDLGGDE